MPQRKPRGESPEAAFAKEVYLSLGPERTLEKLVAELRVRKPGAYTGTDTTLLRHLKEWSARWSWVDTAKAHDRREEEKIRGAATDALASMNAQQAELSALAHMRILGQINRLLMIDRAALRGVNEVRKAIKAGVLPPDTDLPHPKLYLGGQTLVQFWREGIDVERLSRGAATEIAEQQHSGGIALNITSKAVGDAESGDTGERPLPFGLPPITGEDDTGGETGSVGTPHASGKSSDDELEPDGDSDDGEEEDA